MHKPTLLILAYSLKDYDKLVHEDYKCAWIHSVTQLTRRNPGLIILTESAKKIQNFRVILDVCIKRGFQIIDFARGEDAKSKHSLP